MSGTKLERGLARSTYTILMVITILTISTIATPIFTGSAEGDNGWVVDRGTSEYRADERIVLNENLTVKGTLSMKNVSLLVNTSKDVGIRVTKNGVLRLDDCHISPYYKYFRKNISLHPDKGKNLISIPFFSESQDPEDVLSPLEGHYDVAWYYDPDYDFRWRNYKPGKPDHFNNLEKVNHTMGLLVNITEEVSLKQEGYLDSGFERTLKEGRNMVSYPGSKEMNVSKALSNVWGEVESVSKVIQGNETELSWNDTMVPGRGYWVEVKQDCVWRMDNLDGLSREKALSLKPRNETFISYEEGSSGSVVDSKVVSLGGSNSMPGLTISSDTVSVNNVTFIENYVGTSVSSSNPMIKRCSFIDNRKAGIHVKNASPTLYDNRFNTSQGWGIKVDEGGPDISRNLITGTKGIYLNQSNAGIFKNNITGIESNGIFVDSGDPLIENNLFIKNQKPAIKGVESNLSVRKNMFYKNEGGIILDGCRPSVVDNDLIGGGFGIQMSNSTPKIYDNYFSRTVGWAVSGESLDDGMIASNVVENCSFGIKISGESIEIEDNTVSGCDENGYKIDSSKDILFSKNEALDNSGKGLVIGDTDGIFNSNRIIDNVGGIEISSDIQFINNTIADNELFGILISGGSPYLERLVISGNENMGIRCSDSSPTIRMTSILNSGYPFYLLNSRVTVINSIFDSESVYRDSSSVLDIIKRLNVSMEEDKKYRGYNLSSYLPPDIEVNGVSGNGSVRVLIDGSEVDFIPPKNYHGSRNITFNLTVSGVWNTTYPMKLDVEPVNDPPFFNKTKIDIEYEPTKVVWTVEYMDKDDTPPSFIEVVVDGDHHSMKEMNRSDQNYSDGKVYYYEIYLEPGEHDWYVVARENNTLGNNITEKSRTRTLNVDPPKPDWLGIESDTLIGSGVAFLIILLIFVYIFYWRERKPPVEEVVKEMKEEGTLEGEKEEEGEDKSSLPVMSKKGEGWKGIDGKGKDGSLPVLSKKGEEKGTEEGESEEETPDEKEEEESEEESKSKRLRKIKEEEGDEASPSSSPEQSSVDEEPVIDTVGENVEEGEESEEEIGEKEDKRKHRVVKEGEKKVLQVKKRVLKGEDEGEDTDKKKRVLKED